MKTIRRIQMKPIEGKSIKEFADDFNRQMTWVADFSDKFEEPVVDLANLRGYVIYKSEEKVAENYRDQLDLFNLKVTCGQCQKFQSTKYSWGVCDHCRGDLRKADEVCERFFSEWENGNCWLKKGEEQKYAEAIDQFRRSRLCDIQRIDAG